MKTIKGTKKRKWTKLILSCILLMTTLAILGQDAGQSETTLIKKAEQLFNQQDYQNALPLYAQLVSVHPDEPDFNYKFGVCTLFGDKGDKSRPIRYLKNAEKGMKDNSELNYYLGLAYYQNSDFIKAMQYLNLHLAKLAPNSSDRPIILEKVNACLNGINLQGKNLIAEILNSSEFQLSNFHRAYRADEFEGMLLLKPDALNSPLDKKSGNVSFVFVSEPRNVIYFSSLGKDGSNKDIYQATLLENGNWSEPEKLDEIVNSPFDEDYPVLMDNGTTLYFCSKGHNSLGGYDIYRTKLDTANNAFSEPENLGVGINSPFDDILFIIDKTKQHAYFTSDRDNLNGSVSVFKVRMIDDPFNEQLYAQTEALNQLDNFGSNASQGVNHQTTVSNSGQDKSSPFEQSLSQLESSDPAKRAAEMKFKLARNKQMTDSAFLLVANTKDLIRDLTNQRDRANSISQKNAELAKLNEIEFERIIAGMSNIADEVIYETELKKATDLKKDILKFRTLADQSGIIARNLGKGIKQKNDELEQLKLRAGKIQSLAVTGTVDEAQDIFAELMKNYTLADTLPDYNDQIVTIARGNVKVEIPETELAFVDKLRDDFHAETVIAATSSRPKIDESVPIIVVDKRTGYQTENQKNIKASTEPQFEPVILISPIQAENLTYNTFDPAEETIEINFTADQVKPVQQAQHIQFAEMAFANAIPEDEAVEINFDIDRISAIKAAEHISYAELAVLEIPDEDLEIDFISDQVMPIQQAEQFRLAELAFATTFPEDESVEITFNIDKLKALNTVEQVSYGEFAVSEIPDEELMIDFTADQVEAVKNAEMIAYNAPAQSEIAANEELELNLKTDEPTVVIPDRVEQISTENILMAQTTPDEESLEIDFTADQVEAVKNAEMIAYNAPAQSEI
ncbi:MAG: PD40 domain-containing protein, partial [Bacteroidales bacterium]|nr:PD40 domain-containing protein [Bacteroidales bacterium]